MLELRTWGNLTAALTWSYFWLAVFAWFTAGIALVQIYMLVDWKHAEETDAFLIFLGPLALLPIILLYLRRRRA